MDGEEVSQAKVRNHTATSNVFDLVIEKEEQPHMMITNWESTIVNLAHNATEVSER